MLDGPRYSVEHLSTAAGDPVSPAPGLEAVNQSIPLPHDAGGVSAALSLDLSVPPPIVKIEALRENSAAFAKTWTRKRIGKANNWSDSEWDMAVVGYLRGAEFTEQEAASALVMYRQIHGDAAGKGGRPDYIERTVRRAYRDAEKTARQKAIAEERAEAIEELTDLGDQARAGADVRAPALAAFNKLVAGGRDDAPVIVGLSQYGSEFGDTTYALQLRDGTSVPLSPTQLLEPRYFAQTLAVSTRHLMFVPKQGDWTHVVQTLLDNCLVRSGAEDTVTGKVAAALPGYFAISSGQAKEDNLIAESRPFVDKGVEHLSLRALTAWLKREGFLFRQSQVIHALYELGFTDGKLSYRTIRGESKQARYWSRKTAQAADA